MRVRGVADAHAHDGRRGGGPAVKPWLVRAARRGGDARDRPLGDRGAGHPVAGADGARRARASRRSWPRSRPRAGRRRLRQGQQRRRRARRGAAAARALARGRAACCWASATSCAATPPPWRRASRPSRSTRGRSRAPRSWSTRSSARASRARSRGAAADAIAAMDGLTPWWPPTCPAASTRRPARSRGRGAGARDGDVRGRQARAVREPGQGARRRGRA